MMLCLEIVLRVFLILSKPTKQLRQTNSGMMEATAKHIFFLYIYREMYHQRTAEQAKGSVVEHDLVTI